MISLRRAAQRASTALLVLILLSAGIGLCAIWVQSKALEQQQAAASLLRSHLEADMMHDAVRSDVLAALASSDPASGLKREDALSDLNEHLETFDAAIAAERAYTGSAAINQVTGALAQPLADYGKAARQSGRAHV